MGPIFSYRVKVYLGRKSNLKIIKNTKKSKKKRKGKKRKRKKIKCKNEKQNKKNVFKLIDGNSMSPIFGVIFFFLIF